MDKSQKQCHVFDTSQNKWNDRKVPELEQGRHSHSNCFVGNAVYVIAGFDSGCNLNTIERLELRSANDAPIPYESAMWELIQVDSFQPCVRPLVSPLGSDEFLIFGG